MMDICFCFTSEENAKEQLSRFVDDQGNWIGSGTTHALDVIGDLYAQTDISGYDPENLPVPIKLDGFHANLRIWGELEDEIGTGLASSEYVVHTKNQQRVWA
jgi:hypothetical protein